MIVSPNGITYHHLGLYSFHSSWDNIEGVNYVHFRIFGSQRCLILKQGKKLSKISELDWTISNNDREQIIPIPELTTPIELMDDIKKYAPTIYGLR